MKFIILKRKKPLKGGKPIISLYSIVLGVILFSLILQATSKNFLDVLRVILMSFTSPSIVLDVLALTMLGYALLLSFKAATWNIGAEGQFFVAMIPLIYLLIVKYPEFPLPGLMVALATLLAGIM
ncbi:MAG: ABC transporter permease, partial [Desulfurococcaceae archaeon]